MHKDEFLGILFIASKYLHNKMCRDNCFDSFHGFKCFNILSLHNNYLLAQKSKQKRLENIKKC